MARMLSVLHAHFKNEGYGERAGAIIEAHADKNDLPEWMFYPLK